MVIHYVIGEAWVKEKIERIEVEEKVDSDHQPLVIWTKKMEGRRKRKVRME